MAHQLLHIVDRIDLQPAGQSGLGGVLLRDKQFMQAGGLGGQGHGQHAGAGAQAAGQGQLPHKGAVPVPEGQLSPGGQQAHQNGQVVQGADLLHMGGGQVDGDAAHREGEAAVFNGGAHPLPGLVHRRVGEAHHRESGQAAGQVALHRHRVAGDAVEPERMYRIDHLNRPPKRKRKESGADGDIPELL